MILTFAAAFVPLVGATAARRDRRPGHRWPPGGFVPALVVAVVAVLVQQLDNDLLAPWIFGENLELHPVVILLSIAAGTALFGFAGTVMAVPVTATVLSLDRRPAGRDRSRDRGRAPRTSRLEVEAGG